MKKRFFLKTIIVLILAFVFLAGIFLYWASGYSRADATAIAALAGNTKVTVNVSKDRIDYEPVDDEKQIGFIFYPGGKVAPEAYAPLMLQIAEAGYRVVEPKMPLNLAVFKSDAAKEIMQEDSKRVWVLGGHSLGGSMAAYYAFKNPTGIAGLIFLGSYPAKSNDFSQIQLPVLSVYGTADMGIDAISSYKSLLPSDTSYLEIVGGNHAQFGNYGLQKGDGQASISAESQQSQALVAILTFLESTATFQ